MSFRCHRYVFYFMYFSLCFVNCVFFCSFLYRGFYFSFHFVHCATSIEFISSLKLFVVLFVKWLTMRRRQLLYEKKENCISRASKTWWHQERQFWFNHHQSALISTFSNLTLAHTIVCIHRYNRFLNIRNKTENFAFSFGKSSIPLPNAACIVLICARSAINRWLSWISLLIKIMKWLRFHALSADWNWILSRICGFVDFDELHSKNQDNTFLGLTKCKIYCGKKWISMKSLSTSADPVRFSLCVCTFFSLFVSCNRVRFVCSAVSISSEMKQYVRFLADA